MSKRVTLADVAQRAGVSKTAASLILNNRPGSRLSDEAVARVRDAAAELHYRPNPSARSLRLGKTEIVGFISDEVSITRYASAMIRGALDVAQHYDHTVLIAESGSDPDRRAQAVQAMLDRRPDGLIFGLMGAKEIDVSEITNGVPIVILNGSSSAKHRSVVPAEFEAGTQIAEVLVHAGHRRIGIVGYPPPMLFDPRISSTISERLAGIQAALDRAGITLAAKVEHHLWEPHHGFQATHHILDNQPEITGLICMNDRLSFGAYQAIQERGLKVPDDISIVSFDDDEIASYLRPQLTTARIPYEQMGRDAMTMLLDPAASSVQQRMVPMPLQQRASLRTLN
jgi:LacI family transcriptional regulator